MWYCSLHSHASDHLILAQGHCKKKGLKNNIWPVSCFWLSVVIGKASKGILRASTSQPSILRCARRDEGGSTQRGSGGEWELIESRHRWWSPSYALASQNALTKWYSRLWWVMAILFSYMIIGDLIRLAYTTSKLYNETKLTRQWIEHEPPSNGVNGIPWNDRHL